MRKREKGYIDYGLTDEQAKEIIKKFPSMPIDEHLKLLKCAYIVNKSIGNYLYFSIANNMSFDTIDRMIGFLPIGKVDFYAYRRQTVALYAS